MQRYTVKPNLEEAFSPLSSCRQRPMDELPVLSSSSKNLARRGTRAGRATWLRARGTERRERRCIRIACTNCMHIACASPGVSSNCMRISGWFVELHAHLRVFRRIACATYIWPLHARTHGALATTHHVSTALPQRQSLVSSAFARFQRTMAFSAAMGPY